MGRHQEKDEGVVGGGVGSLVAITTVGSLVGNMVVGATVKVVGAIVKVVGAKVFSDCE